MSWLPAEQFGQLVAALPLISIDLVVRNAQGHALLGHGLTLDLPLASLPAEQHAGYRWWPVADLLTSPDVHLHTRWYFQNTVETLKRS